MPTPVDLPLVSINILGPLLGALTGILFQYLKIAAGLTLAFFAIRMGVRYIMRAIGGYDTKVITFVDKQGNARFIYQKRF